MKKLLFLLLLGFASWLHAWAGVHPTQPVADLVNRVCGTGASDHFVFTLNPELNGGKEAFQLGYLNEKVTVTGSSLSALTTGLNWYLKHDAHVHISWNNLTETPAAYPVPKDQNVHATTSEYRYYLNYCTFSYSMSMWDEARWMKELDWMALHGINLPLQIVGIDAVWYQMLTEDFGFTHDEANQFVVGPAFQGWWLMNNIVALGGPNPKWWYDRSAALGKKISDRMRELGMKPCLPGFVGMVPHKYVTDKGLKSFEMKWCGMQSPDILNPSGQTDAFNQLAQKYYERIQKVYGFAPEHYSLDPIHENQLPGGMTQSDYKGLCDLARSAMDKWGVPSGKKGVWVAQEWQVNADQYRIDALPVENTLLLDLSSERVSYVDRFGSRSYLFCMLHNYGGNIGLYGRIADMLKRYETHVTNHSNILKGVGATPEGIETNPVLYDLLFELPWRASVPTAKAWLHEYTECRYGINSPEAKEAWDNLLVTVYEDIQDDQQGCREPVFCARPNLDGNGASAWANAYFDWDKSKVIRAAYLMLAAQGKNANYTYDMVDIVRQALSDYGHTLQMDMKQTSQTEGFKSERFATQSDAFLALIDDLDAFLGTLSDFRVGRFTEDARRIAQENNAADKQDWMERNIRMLFSTWGENGEIIDYANREYQGMMADYYKPRWVLYFNDLKQKGGCGRSWLNKVEKPWMSGTAVSAKFGKYTSQAVDTKFGGPKKTAQALMDKYFGVLKGGSYYTAFTNNDFSSTLRVAITSTADFDKIFDRKHTGAIIARYAIDADGDGVLDAEKNITEALQLPDMAARNVKARVIMNDGTRIDFLAIIGKELAQGRLVCVSVNDPSLGNASVDESTINGTFSKGAVVLTAKPKNNALFLGWMKNDLNIVSTQSPFIYADAASESFQACFGSNVWKTVEEDKNGVSETKQHNAYITKFEYSINDGDFQTIHTANAAPEKLYQRIVSPIKVKAGDKVTIRWTAADGIKFCFLSAYVDDDATRGTFNNCFYTKGNKDAQCEELLTHQATYTVGNQLKDGMTTLRLRFDGAWFTSNWDGNNKRFFAEGITNRPVYDFTLLIGEPTHTSVLDRFTHEGWAVACQQIEAGKISLTGAWPLNNETHFSVPERVNGKPFGQFDGADCTYEVVSLNEHFFEQGAQMSEITLPATLTKIGNAQSYTTIVENQDGNQKTINIGSTLPTDAWSLEADVKMPSESYNEWGSCVLATGSDAFNGNFNKGFQLYLYSKNHPEKKSGLCIKTSAGETILPASEMFDMYGKEVTISLSYESGKLVCQFASNGAQAQKEVSCSIQDVSQLTWAMKGDARFHSIRYAQTSSSCSVAQVIAGAKALQSIHVEKGNAAFSSEEGVMYSADKSKLIALPVAMEGTVNLPETATKLDDTALQVNTTVLFRVVPQQFASLRASKELSANRVSINLSDNWDAQTWANNSALVGSDELAEVSISDKTLSTVGWNTVSLPFALNEQEANLLFAEAYVLKGLMTSGADDVTLAFEKATAADLSKAGLPLLVKMNDNASFTFKNKSIAVQPAAIEVKDDTWCVRMKGNYHALQLKDQEYALKQTEFLQAESPTEQRGFQAYITLLPASEGTVLPKLLYIKTDGTTTGQEDSMKLDSSKESGVIYTLDGRRVSPDKAKRGVYIQNHKKIIRK